MKLLIMYFCLFSSLPLFKYKHSTYIVFQIPHPQKGTGKIKVIK
jgi:hypothetical protein